MSWLYSDDEQPRFYGTRLWNPVYRVALRLYRFGVRRLVSPSRAR